MGESFKHEADIILRKIVELSGIKHIDLSEDTKGSLTNLLRILKLDDKLQVSSAYYPGGTYISYHLSGSKGCSFEDFKAAIKSFQESILTSEFNEEIDSKHLIEEIEDFISHYHRYKYHVFGGITSLEENELLIKYDFPKIRYWKHITKYNSLIAEKIKDKLEYDHFNYIGDGDLTFLFLFVKKKTLIDTISYLASLFGH